MPSISGRIGARLRWTLARHRWVARLLLVIPAAVAGLIVQQQVAAADRTQRSWSERREVLVVRRPIAVGELVSTADVRRVEVPVVAIGPAPVTDLDHPIVARHPLAAGEQLLAHHLGEPETGELPPGHVGVAVPLPTGAGLPVTAGSRVDVFIGSNPISGDGAPLGAEHDNGVTDVAVTTVSDGIAVVAIPEAAAERIAVAASLGRVTLAWRSGPLATAPAAANAG